MIQQNFITYGNITLFMSAVALFFFCCLICYGARIRVEEKAPQPQFGRKYADYKRITCKLLPYIF